MSTDIFTTVGTVVVFLFAGMAIGTGMGITTFTIWVINKFLTHVMKTFRVWKLFVDFVCDYNQFKEWKNDNKNK
jgi:hypothetical protein